MEQLDLAAGAARPDHVPTELVYDYDFNADPELARNPFTVADRLLEQAPPMFWTPRNGGHWFITGFELVCAAARDHVNFTNQIVPKEMVDLILAKMPPGTFTPLNVLPSSLDPPEHTTYRAPLNALFSPKVAMGLKEEIRGLAVDLIERVRSNGQCELMHEVTEPLPVQMFLKLFGLPVENAEHYRNVVKSVMTGNVHDLSVMINACQTLVQTYSPVLIERRDNPQDDIISKMWQLEIEGKPMTLEVMQSYCLSLFLAGLDTVMNAMTYGTRHLAMDPELQAQLREDPSLIVQMTEEMLRLYSFPNPIRVAGRDFEFEGIALKQGDRVHLCLSAADRDPKHFGNPLTFDMTRDLKRHVGFGDGVHRCVGMHLARVELHVYYEELLRRLPRFRLDPDKPPSFHGGMVIGPDHLHLLWDN
jgi:cytochrome P450